MKTDVLIIGSSAAGLVAATTGKRIYKDKSFMVVTKQPKTLIPCGIPYIFGSVGSSEKDLMPAGKMFESMEIGLVVDEIMTIERTNKRAILASGEAVEYDKLVIATGSQPKRPVWMRDLPMKEVFTVPKNKEYLDNMQAMIRDFRKIVVIGGGFIGVELSDELTKAGKEVTLIEKLPHILALAFDPNISEIAESLLKERGVNILYNIGVKSVLGDTRVTGVELEDGRIIETDAVVISVGYNPDSRLAAEAGLPVNAKGFIKVDEYMRTEDPAVFAVGDCAEKRDFVTRKPSGVMLASTACAEARIAGMNLFKLSAIKTFSGTISIFSTAIGNTGFGVAGLTETIARNEGFDIVTGVFEGIDRHPGSLADTHKQYVKLIVGKESGVILGGEVYGGLSIGELTNTIGIIIQNRMSINSLLTAQIGTHPLLTASPAGYPLIKAAENASDKIMFNGHS